MKWVSAFFFAVTCASLVGMVACSQQQVHDTAETISSAAGSAAPLLPPPFGTILGLVAGAAGLVASATAAKAKGDALVADRDPNVVANFISTHTWIYPAVMAAAGLARMKGWIHLSDSEITALFSSLGVASAVHVVADAKAEKRADIAAGASSAISGS